MFIDTGARLSAVTNLRWDSSDGANNDVDLSLGILRVVEKGRRERALAAGKKTVRTLDRYLRKRSQLRTQSLTYYGSDTGAKWPHRVYARLFNVEANMQG